MKNIILNSLLVASTVFGLSSCDKVDGSLYTPDANKASFLAASGSFWMANGVVEVPVDRPDAKGEFSFPVTLTSADKNILAVFSANDEVLFAAGDLKTTVKVKYTDVTKVASNSLAVEQTGVNIKAGISYPFTLTIAKQFIAPRDIQRINVAAASPLEFEEIGTGEIDSRGGWGEDIFPVKIQKAKTAEVYKVVSPLGDYSIAFLVRADGTTITFPDQLLVKDAKEGNITLKSVTGKKAGNVITLSGTYAAGATTFGTGKEIIKLPTKASAQ